MSLNSLHRFLLAAPLAVVFIIAGFRQSACGEDILFIGNSYTFGGPEMVIHKNGGIPKLVEAIAASKTRKAATMMLTAGGKDWAYHLKEPGTETALAAEKWNFVVLQDFSTKPTHMGNPGEFMQDGEMFYKRIHGHSPLTKIVLYETWAREKGHAYYTGVSTPASFIDPAQMNDELDKEYAQLDQRLESMDPGNQVLLAPVGEAFARCLKEHPEISLYWQDKHHASTEGNYLAALVIYSVIFQDSPLGATREFFGTAIDARDAAALQQVAAEAITAKKSAASAAATTPAPAPAKTG